MAASVGENCYRFKGSTHNVVFSFPMIDGMVLVKYDTHTRLLACFMYNAPCPCLSSMIFKSHVAIVTRGVKCSSQEFPKIMYHRISRQLRRCEKHGGEEEINIVRLHVFLHQLGKRSKRNNNIFKTKVLGTGTDPPRLTKAPKFVAISCANLSSVDPSHFSPASHDHFFVWVALCSC